MSSFFGSPAGRIFAAALALAAGVGGYLYWASAGARELNRALPLVANAKSWHLVHTLGPMRVEEDVVCPFDYDQVTTLGPQSGRTIHIGHSFYTQSSTGQWNTGVGNEFGHCADGPQIDNLGLAVNLRFMVEKASISRGDIKVVAGQSCRVWNLLPRGVSVPGSPDHVATICIDEQTHYPMELSRPGDTYQFANWNGVPEIQPPDTQTAAPQPAPASYTAPTDAPSN
jgi:hypothetical protein